MASRWTMTRILVTLAALTGLAGPVVAHQRQLLQVGPADYLLVIGSLDEPVFTGDKSGVDLTVLIPDAANAMDSRAERAKPVEGLEKTLKVEVKAGPTHACSSWSPGSGRPAGTTRSSTRRWPRRTRTGSSARSTARPSTSPSRATLGVTSQERTRPS